MEWADVPAKEVRDEKTGFLATYEYTKAGDLKKVDTPVLHTAYAYDGDRNLTALRTMAAGDASVEKILADNTYRYNKNGQRTEKTTLAGTTKYTYDVLGQLIQENNHIYTYDRAGNRTSVQTDDRREIYSYDRGRLRNRTVERQQDPAGSQTYTYRYDAQGNTLSDGENTYLYDCLNRITEVKTKAGDIQKNHYDAEGLRSQMEENGKLVSFIYADREVIAEEDEAGEHIRYIRGHELLASDSERARTYYHYACDEMGSITDITDCHGTVLNHYAYDAFGNRTVEEETVENRFGFAGEILDAVTGQYYLRARFYNLVRYVDPSGHEGLICSKKYGELKKKEAEGGTLSEKEKRQIYEYEQNQKKSNGPGSDSKSGSESSIMDYSNRFADSLADDFNHGVEVRDVVKVARVKKGTEVTHAIGTAKAQTKISDPRPGNGKQILFSKLDSNKMDVSDGGTLGFRRAILEDDNLANIDSLYNAAVAVDKFYSQECREW